MSYRNLGKSEIQVSKISFGGNIFGWTVDEKKSFELLDVFLGEGFNFIDTADIYSFWVPGNKGGESETVIGNWIEKRKNREKLVLATKVGITDFGNSRSLKREHILKSVDLSLKRLKTDYIDLYQSHEDDLDTPQTEVLSTYQDLIKSGKIRIIGASNFTAKRFNESLEISKQENLPRYETVQPHYNLMERENFEKDLESLVLSEKVGVISYFSLASGFLSGKYRSKNDLNKSVRGGMVEKYMDEKGFGVIDALYQISETHKVSPAAIAIAWLIHRKSITAPIVSATSIDQLKQILSAASVQLSQEDINLLNLKSSYV